MEWQHRILSLRPPVVSVVLVALLIGGAIVSRQRIHLGHISGGMVLTLIALTLMLVWARALYIVSNQMTNEGVIGRYRRSMVMEGALLAFILLWFVGIVRAVVVGPFGVALAWLEPSVLVLAVLLYLAAIWAAASALVKFESKQSAPWHATVGIFLLIFYLIFGIWFLHGRISKMLNQVR
jgi:hypothetical protein